MQKFKNLPVGTVVELTEKAAKYSVNKGHKIMTTISKMNEIFSENSYRTKELDGGLTNYIHTFEIERIVSYPIDRDKLKAGVKIKIRSDLEVGKRYGILEWHGEKTNFLGEVVTIEIVRYDCGFTFEEARPGAAGNFLVPEMIEKIIDEPVFEPNKTLVDGVEALVAMNDGKYAFTEGNEEEFPAVYSKEDGEIVMRVNRNHEDWKPKQNIGNPSLLEFIETKYRILDELPAWAIDKPKCLFVEGQVIIREDANLSPGNVMQFLEVLPSNLMKVQYRHHIGESVYTFDQYRLATPEEELMFWKARAEYLEGEK